MSVSGVQRLPSAVDTEYCSPHCWPQVVFGWHAEPAHLLFWFLGNRAAGGWSLAAYPCLCWGEKELCAANTERNAAVVLSWVRNTESWVKWQVSWLNTTTWGREASSLYSITAEPPVMENSFMLQEPTEIWSLLQAQRLTHQPAQLGDADSLCHWFCLRTRRISSTYLCFLKELMLQQLWGRRPENTAQWWEVGWFTWTSSLFIIKQYVVQLNEHSEPAWLKAESQLSPFLRFLL